MERRREDPEPPIDSKLTAMPESVPIDWFEPEAWNSFTVRERVEYTAGGINIGLPLEMYCDSLGKCADWKNLPEEEFMEKYGKDVLAQYHMPTEAEKAQLLEYEGEQEEDIDLMDYFDDDDFSEGAGEGSGTAEEPMIE
jgi:hypothetical protein